MRVKVNGYFMSDIIIHGDGTFEAELNVFQSPEQDIYEATADALIESIVFEVEEEEER